MAEMSILLVVGVLAVAIGLVLGSRSFRRWMADVFRPVIWLLGQLDRLLPWHLGFMILVFMLFGLLTLHEPTPVFVMGSLAFLLVFFFVWLREIGLLMFQPDEAFPGRNDKLIWMLLMIFLPPIGVLTFRSFRRAQVKAEAKAARANGWSEVY